MSEEVGVSFDDEAVGYLRDILEVEKTVKAIGSAAAKDEARTAFLNLPKIRQVDAVYKIAIELFKGTGCKVYYELHKPYKSMGYVTIEGKNICFSQAKWLTRLGQIANNFEVYPLTNGDIRLTFTFHGLVVPVK